MPGEEIEFDMAGALEDLDGEFEEVEDGSEGAKFEVTPPSAETKPAETPPSDSAALSPSLEVPKTWRAEAAASWTSLPPIVREEILKREADIFRGIEGYKSDAAFGRSFQTALAPFLPTLSQHGIDPVSQVASLMKAHHTLALGTAEEKASLFQRLASDYGVSLSPPGEAPFQDPAVTALQEELRTLKSTITSAERVRETATRAELEKSISAFAADPANPFFEDLANDMAVLLQKGVCTNLSEAYEKALWSNPATRAKELSRQQAEASKAQEVESTKRLLAAKSASAANLRTKAKPGSAATPSGSMDETLESAYAAILSRS